ncbi:GMC family oxidoreductase [Diaphorobacter sp. HDW4A]|uniref:GMC family oxidoreductase n=1 Tax=Diaphorobacter sp. HDW4A TaxID=2714924 RepID=UPI00140AF878|nr:GMC family oxidoreductase [Diaphorobacter sp. HDW4A]QIL80255.1 GMC family oxidoreductase [Diaphorobacter sp. HDW4A]
MTIKKDKVDVVLVGFGWTGAIMAQELTEEGLQVLALERGPMQDTPTDAKYPKVIDELAYSVRGKLYQDLSTETVTVRHKTGDLAVPYRQHGSFLLGNGVGGAGFHWNGMTFRNLPEELRLYSNTVERYGKKFMPEDMTLQDHGVTYEELEPYYSQFEYVCGTSGTAGVLNGARQAGGNPFEGSRSKAYPTPALKYVYGESLVEKAALAAGMHPYPLPASNASEPYTNPYGVRLGPCNFCGFCEHYGCYMYSKASPQTTIMPALMKKPNFELRTRAHVLKVLMDNQAKKATGVLYVDSQGREVEQPADLVILCAYQMHNVRLLLLSGIGKPYDPQSGEGVVGKNYAYQMNGGVSVLLKKGTYLNPFIGAGASGVVWDDFNGDQFDHGPHGFIGGATTKHARAGGRPIKQSAIAPGTPKWGSGWKAGMQEGYQRILNIGLSGSVMPYRDSYLDLDPTYRDAYGMPLLRMTFDWHDNEFDMLKFVGDKAELVAKELNPEKMWSSIRKKGSHYDVRPYQTTHNTGGAIMGTNPKNSVVNRFLQCWDVSNVFVQGASAFPYNMGYNPTGLVGALTYWSVHAIRTQYLKNPGPLVQA